MAQIADKCPGIIQFCRTRVTLLDADGTPATGPDTSYVSDKMVSLAITSDVEQGQRRTVRSGCGCIVVTQRSSDTLLGYTFELVDGVWEPALQALMLGRQPLYDTSDEPVVIGLNTTADQLVCGGTQAKVALEAWAYAWNGAAQDADLGVVHFLWPMTRWQEAPATLGEEPTTPTLAGYSEGNGNWGYGPYEDAPTDGTGLVAVDFHARWLEALDSMPEPSCGYQTIAA